MFLELPGRVAIVTGAAWGIVFAIAELRGVRRRAVTASRVLGMVPP